MTEQQLELVQVAKDLLAERYAPPVHSVAAALRTKNGEIITGINIDHFSGFVCAETSALSYAINQKIYDFDSIVAVRMNSEGQIAIANMCGKCQIFHDYASDITVITDNDGGLSAKNINDILPDSFKRQQEKIHAIIEEVKKK